jgi:hypothetical protein
MLNETYHLSTILHREGISPTEWHKDFKPLPNVSSKSPCYCLLFGPDCSVAGIEPLSKKQAASLRKWETSNGSSFPGFNIQPLYRITDEGAKKLLKKWREGKAPVDFDLIKSWCSDHSAKNWDDKFGKKMSKCLGTVPHELLGICSSIPGEFSEVTRLCARAVELGNGGLTRFFQALDAFLWASFERGAQVIDLLPVLIHEGSPANKPENDRGSVSVFLDVPDWKEYPVAHEKTIKHINACLLGQTRPKSPSDSNSSTDAFGLPSEGQEEKLPEVKLPILGGIKLRAMFSEIPCQYRYGTIDSGSYRIGADSRKCAKGALEWIKDESRKGQTWGRVDGREVLFAYPTIIRKRPLMLASIFGARNEDDTEMRFADYAKDVIKCLEGVAPSLKDVGLQVFSLRKMDKARTKVVFHRNYSAQRLADAAQDWQDGCANTPLIKMKAWGKEKGTLTIAEPEVPFPLQIADCLNRIWRLDGTSGEEVKSVPKSAGIELLLDESAAIRQAPHMLTLALRNGNGLFLSLGEALHRNDVLNLKGLNEHKLLMPAVLGLLLWKAGIRKERYMEDSSYVIGKMLKIADELHALYCKEVRKGSLPPQLLGNALMAAALNSPTQALAQLALRIPPYLGWARTNSTDSAGLSRFFLKEFSILESKIQHAKLPPRLENSARAQLLLGYISANSRNEEINK